MAREGTSIKRRWRRFLFIPLASCATAALGVNATSGADLVALANPAYDRGRSAAATQLVQARDPDEDRPISPPDVQKYIAVYTAMQRDHQLTVEQAASREGLTLEQFRALEFRIERDPAIHDRVLKALRNAAKNRSQGTASKQDQ